MIQPVMPIVAMICTSMCIGSPLAINRTQILSVEGLRLIGPVLTFHAAAFTLGYWISRIPILRYSYSLSVLLSLPSNPWASFYAVGVSGRWNGWSKKSSLHILVLFNRLEEEVSRTISLCTGMQSSTLAGLLATQFLKSTQSVPPACSVVAMAIMGLCLASFWGSGYRIRDLPSLLVPQSSSTVKAWQKTISCRWRDQVLWQKLATGLIEHPPVHSLAATRYKVQQTGWIVVKISNI